MAEGSKAYIRCFVPKIRFTTWTGKAGSGWVSRDRRLTHESFSAWSPLSVSSCAPLTTLRNPSPPLAVALAWLYCQTHTQKSPPKMLVCQGLKVFSHPCCSSIPIWQRWSANPGYSAVAHVNKQQANVQVTLLCANTPSQWSYVVNSRRVCSKDDKMNKNCNWDGKCGRAKSENWMYFRRSPQRVP